MRFGSGLAFVYDETWAFIRRAWWLALIPWCRSWGSWSLPMPVRPWPGRGQTSSYSVVASVADILFNAAGDLLSIAAQFVVAHKAGIRVSEDRSLAAVFD